MIITPPSMALLNIANVSLFDVDQKKKKARFAAHFPSFRDLLVNTF